MPRLLRDRFIAYDDVHGCDLATGTEVRLDALPDEIPEEAPPALVEVLNGGQDGSPRWVVADAGPGGQVGGMARRAAAAARARGYVPILVSLYETLRDSLAEDLSERALLLIGSPGASVASARSALVDASARSPRPHVLLTFQPSSRVPGVGAVREARTAYPAGVPAAKVGSGGLPQDVQRHLDRAARAPAFQRAGRHAAAERLLRDVAAALLRREAWAQAGATLIALGRLLLERGRATSAERVLGESASLGPAGGHAMGLDARLWQAAARTDADRLSDAESLCRAVLLADPLPEDRRAWALATLARVLCWQGRVDEALRIEASLLDGGLFERDALVAATIDATAVRLLLAAGRPFDAGLRAGALLARADSDPDPVVRLVALTAHLRVLASAGDLRAAERRFGEVCALAREARAPLRGVRARLVWHAALQRAGRGREAQRELSRMTRLRRVVPPLLRRAIEGAATPSVERPPDRGAPIGHVSSRDAAVAGSMIHQVFGDDGDEESLQRLLSSLARDLGASRIELVSADAGPPTAVISSGVGLATHAGRRVLEAGIRIELADGGRETGVPIRLGSHLLAALVCRWALDRQPPGEAAAVLTLAAAIAAPRVETLLARARQTARAASAVPELIGGSAAMTDVRRSIERAARAPFAILIEGESGVGKELAARAIHQLSARRERRFCDVNCAALPEELLESELFGHARGAFTGAVADRAGFFEEADGGTLFLDEVADLSPRGQAKLLRVIQQQEVRRVGETFARKVDVRLVTAANRDMRVEAAADRFRSDLLYRLDVIRIRIPPLRERPEDIAVLAQHFWQQAAARTGSAAVLTHAVVTALARYSWPGNVRELQNVMAALAVAGPARGRVRASLLPAAISSTRVVGARTLADARVEFERRFVEVALARAGGSRTRAAADVGLSRQGLQKTLLRLGIDPAPDLEAPAGG